MASGARATIVRMTSMTMLLPIRVGRVAYHLGLGGEALTVGVASARQTLLSNCKNNCSSDKHNRSSDKHRMLFVVGCGTSRCPKPLFSQR